MNILNSSKKTLLRIVISKTAINTYLVFFGNGLSAFFAFIFTVMYTNSLMWEDVGYFSALLSLLLLVSDLADVGIGTSLSAFLPSMEETREKLLSFLKTAFFLQVAIGGLVTLLLLVLSNTLSTILFHTREMSLLLQVTIVGIFFIIMANFCQYALSARQKFGHVSFLYAFGGFIRLFLFLLIFFWGLVNLSSLVYIQTLSVLILFVAAIFILKVDFLSFKRIPGDLKKLVKFTSFLGIARGLTALAGRLDVLMIISLRGPTEAGIYATASRIIAIYPLLTGSFGTVIAPRLSALTEVNLLKQFMTKVIFATLALLSTVIMLIIVAEPFMLLLFPQKGIEAFSVFQLLLVSMIFFVASLPAVSLAIYYLRKPHILTINSVFQLFIAFFGNLIFIPNFGRFGAAFSLILAYGITLFSTCVLTFYYFRQKHP